MVTPNNDLNFLIFRDKILWELDNFNKINIIELKKSYENSFDEIIIDISLKRLEDEGILNKKGNWYTKKNNEKTIFD